MHNLQLCAETLRDLCNDANPFKPVYSTVRAPTSGFGFFCAYRNVADS